MAKNWTRENIAWIAGIIEGEGCFQMTNNAINIVVNMTDEDVIRKIHRLSGLGRFWGPLENPPHKPMYRWRVSDGFGVYAMLAAIHPYLGVRRQTRCEELMRWFAKRKVWKSKIHGTRARFKAGCRCEPCKRACYDYQAAWLAQRNTELRAA